VVKINLRGVYRFVRNVKSANASKVHPPRRAVTALAGCAALVAGVTVLGTSDSAAS